MDSLHSFFAHILITSWDLQNVTLLSIVVRMGLAVLFGGIIGLERGTNKHAAGFRTHILVCLGATLAMLTNQYVVDYIAPAADPTRLGAQVISGIGFLGVGTIIMSGKTKIRGLTTAAGLWASACVGLALGIGFYVGAILAAIFVFISLAFLSKFEGYFYGRSRVTDIYVEVASSSYIDSILESLMAQTLEVYDFSMHRLAAEPGSVLSLHLNIMLAKDQEKLSLLSFVAGLEGVVTVEEL